MLGTLNIFKKLFALALVSALGLGMSAAQAQGFDHRDGNHGFHHTAPHHGEFRHGRDARRHGDFRHGHHVRHHRFDHRHHRHFGHR